MAKATCADSTDPAEGRASRFRRSTAREQRETGIRRQKLLPSVPRIRRQQRPPPSGGWDRPGVETLEGIRHSRQPADGDFRPATETPHETALSSFADRIRRGMFASPCRPRAARFARHGADRSDQVIRRCGRAVAQNLFELLSVWRNSGQVLNVLQLDDARSEAPGFARMAINSGSRAITATRRGSTGAAAPGADRAVQHRRHVHAPRQKTPRDSNHHSDVVDVCGRGQ